MITFTTPIQVRNIVKSRAWKFTADPDTNTAAVLIEVIGAGNTIYGQFICSISNGECQGVRPNATSVTYSDVMQQFTVPVATGYTDILAAFTANGNLATKLRAVETAMQSAGLLPVGVVS